MNPPSPLLVVAALLWAATIILTLMLLVPCNNRIAAADPEHPYVGWEKDRAAWDRLHRVRVVILTVAFTLLLVALLAPAA